MRHLPVKTESNRDSQDKEKNSVSEIPTIKPEPEYKKAEDTKKEETKTENTKLDETKAKEQNVSNTSTNEAQDKINEADIEIDMNDSNLLGDGSDDSDKETDEFGFEIIE